MSNGIADSAVGAILEIPPKALADIQKTENAINKLKMTSAEAAGSVNLHWGEVATTGLGKFIQKIAETNEALKNLGGSTADVKLNTESATQQMSNFTEKVQSDSSKISQSVQEIASTPIDAKGVKEYAEAWNSTFQDVQDKIKALRNGLKVQTTEGQGAQVQLQAIKAWEDYYKSVSKVNEETNKHGRVVNELRTKINDVQQAIDHENAVIARFSQKVQDAWTAVNAFKTANPNFNVDKAEQQLESLRGKIQRLYEQLDGGGLSEKKENRIVREIEQFKQQFATLDNTIATARRVYRELAEAEDTYESRANNSTRIIGQKNAELSSLTAKLGKAEQAQALFNAELEKGNTAKSLASEYAKLTKRLQEVNDTMNKFQASGGNVNSASYQSLQTEWQNIMTRRKEIEKMDIAEVNQYRQQMNQSAYQQDLSAWVQAEAQKTAEAKKQAEERAKQQAEAQQKYLNTYAGAISEFYRLGRRGGNYADTYENRERVIKNLEAAIKSLNKADADYESKLKDLTDALKRLKDAQKEVNDVMKQKPQVTLADANQARKIAEQTKTLKDYETAYKLLIEVMKQTPQGRAWDAMNRKAQEMKTHIDEIKKKMGEFQSQASKTNNVMNQLQGRIAAAFSVGAIMGFIKKMVEVRAQFELQRVALGAIIQDRDEANKIFTQVQNMALESPFNIMQLEKATKQIAAFGFETKKLVPTMKMFADISAGLGVEIDRLVLVMGHLKARNFLEGCLGLGTPVKMADGSVKRVEDIMQGENIMGDDDTPRIVKQIIRGNEQMYKVCYADGSFRCNEKHILTLFNTEKNVIEDVYVLDYLKKPDTYKGVRRTNGRFEYFDIAVEEDMVDNYYGFVIDGNRRFQLGDGTVTHNTMVRQFTNMGFNVLGELSKYYSELEDRMVSVGEVQDRVKKKMISFEDVEEVLKRVTSAGGMFYDMQKKQSDSLWGQMQRITDAYDLMLNEIGQSNEGVIKSALTAIRELIQSWRTLKPYIVAAVSAMGSYMVVATGYKAITLTLSGLRLGYILLTQGIQAAKAAQQALNITMLSNPWAAAAAAITALVVCIWQATTATSKLNEELSRIGSDMTDSLNESIVTFKQLADTISDTNSTYTERTEAMTEMRRVYAEILPKEKLEIAYIQSLKGNYGELTKAIQEYYQQKEYNQKVEAIQGSDEAKKVQEQLEKTLNQMNEDGAFDMKYSKSMIKSWSDTIAKEINTGKIPATLDSLESRIKEVFNAKDLSMFRNETYGVSDMYDVMQEVEKVQKVYGDITIETANAENALASYQNALKKFDFSQLDEAKKSLQEQRDSLKRDIERGYSQKDIYGNDSKFGPSIILSAEQLEDYKERLNQVESQIKAVDEAQAQWLSNQFKEKVEELNKVLSDDVEKYKAARDEMRKLEMQGKKNTEEWKKQESAMNNARESADKTAKKYGTEVTWSLIDSAQTSFELRGELDKLATKAFPKVAELAMKSLSKLQEYLLKSKNTVYEWVKGLLEWIPESARDAMGLNTILANVDKNLALTKTQLDNLAKAAEGVKDKGKAAGKSFEELISDKAKTRVKEFGGNITDIDRIISDTSKGADAMAKELRSQAKTWEETAQSYRTSTDKALWLNTRNMTEESIALMEKNAKAAKALATDLAGVDPHEKKKKGGKGKDEILELWKNRLKAIQDFYKRYEELRKHFDETESLTRAKDAFTPLFKSLYMNINDVIAKGMGKQGLVLNLEEMTKEVAKVRKNLVDEFQKATADTQIQVDFKIKEDSEKQLKQQLDEMFANYELTEELKKMSLNVDLVFMLGGEPMDLNDLKAKLKKGFEDTGGEAASENEVKEYKDKLAKIADLELKQRKERIKEYNKYFVKTVGERARIELEYLKKMDDVRKMYEFTDAQRQDAIRQLTEEKNKKLADQVWKDFKDGEVYQMMFNDLDNISKGALETMRTELERIRDSFKGLSPKDLKEINKAITNIDEQIVNRNPFKALGKSFKDLAKYAKERKKIEEDFQKAVKRSGELMNEITKKETQLSQLREKSSLYKVDQINEQIDNLNKQIAELEKDGMTPEEESKINALKEQIRLLEEKKKKLEEKKKKLEEIAALNQDEEDSMHNQIKGLESEVSGLNVELGESNDAAKGAGNKISTGAKKAKDISESFSQIRHTAEEMLSEINGIIDGLDRMGVLSDAFKDTWGSINDIFSGLMDFADGGAQAVAGFMSGDIVGGIQGTLKSIKGAVNVIASIFEIGDKKKERQIKGLTEKVETLDKAYQRLEKSIESAYTFSNYNAGYKQMQQNLNSQKRAYQEMIRLEEAKKKTDKEKVKEYKEKLQEIADAQDELKKQRHEMYGSTDDVWSEANNWVDAWLDAYKETGDGLDALNDSWDEFYENLVKKQAASKVLGARMDNWIKQINDTIDASIDGSMSELDIIDAYKRIGDEIRADMDAVNVGFKEIFKYAGIDGGNGSLILSDLQKGIQNITEPQAAAIEAYLNSMRGAVWKHTEQLDTLIATIQMQYGSGAENPVVTELKSIRGVLDNIHSTLKSVVNDSAGRSYIQVG